MNRNAIVAAIEINRDHRCVHAVRFVFRLGAQSHNAGIAGDCNRRHTDRVLKMISTQTIECDVQSALPSQYEHTDSQIRFMRLHLRTHDVIVRWRLVLGDMYCRAETEFGHHATIHVTDLTELMNAGLMRTVGEHGADLTEIGVAYVNTCRAQ